MSASASSVSFVITAIYTYTFGNAVFRVLEFNEAATDIRLRDGTTVAVLLCLCICIVMALRYFFGNNQYVEKLFSKPTGAGQRLYHLTIVVGQSLILLAASYLVRNPEKFFLWIGILFAVEIVWYGGCCLFYREEVVSAGSLARPLLRNEIANIAMTAVGIGSWALWRYNESLVTIVFAAVFIMNTVIDGRVNFKSYMGIDSKP